MLLGVLQGRFHEGYKVGYRTLEILYNACYTVLQVVRDVIWCYSASLKAGYRAAYRAGCSTYN